MGLKIRRFLQYIWRWKRYDVLNVITNESEEAITYYLLGFPYKTIYRIKD